MYELPFRLSTLPVPILSPRTLLSASGSVQRRQRSLTLYWLPSSSVRSVSLTKSHDVGHFVENYRTVFTVQLATMKLDLLYVFWIVGIYSFDASLTHRWYPVSIVMLSNLYMWNFSCELEPIKMAFNTKFTLTVIFHKQAKQRLSSSSSFPRVCSLSFLVSDAAPVVCCVCSLWALLCRPCHLYSLNANTSSPSSLWSFHTDNIRPVWNRLLLFASGAWWDVARFNPTAVACEFRIVNSCKERTI